MSDHTPADKPDLPLKRSIETWGKCDPVAMAAQSEAAIYFAFQDLLSDVQTLARARADERRRAEPEIIAAFLERSGQWLTNESTHKAALDEARAQARAEMIAEMVPAAYVPQPDLDELAKTGRRAVVIYNEPVSNLDVALAIIPKD